MAEEKTPEETVKEAVYLHGLLMSIPSNIRLNDKILIYAQQHTNFEELRESLIPIAKENFTEIVCWSFLKDVFDIAFNIHYFHTQPFKVVNYIKLKLLKFETSLRRFYIDLLFDIINDRSRFDFRNDALVHIIDELQSLDINFDKVVIQSGISDWEYFTGKNELIVDKAFITSFMAVRGLLRTKEDYYLSFLKENYSPELLNAISQLGLTIVNPPFYNTTSKTKLKKLLSADILELKPNIGGIGININEIINRLSKK